MKRIKQLMIFFLAGILLLLASCSEELPTEASKDASVYSSNSATESVAPESSVTSQEEESSLPEIELDQEESYMKAVWLSQYDLMSVYRKDGVQRDATSFTALMETVLDNVKKDGYNTVIVQVRPFGDAMYPSALYPVSSYVIGADGYPSIPEPEMKIYFEDGSIYYKNVKLKGKAHSAAATQTSFGYECPWGNGGVMLSR